MRGAVARPLLAVMACLCVLTGCVHDRVSPSQLTNSPLDKARGPEENAKLYTDLIRQLIQEDRLYAALAHLQAREQQFGDSDELRLLRADILRKMNDRANAEAIYKALLNTPFAGQANHGLGLIYAPANLARGTTFLQRAVDQSPTDARMRNDLGYALLRQGRIAQARLQLATAYQLDEDNELNRNNYILLLLMEGRDQKARRIAARSQVPVNVMQDLQAQARRLSSGQARAARPSTGEASPRGVAGRGASNSAPVTVGGGGG